MTRPAFENVGVERHDDVRLVEVIDGVGVAAEGKAHPLAHIVATGGFPLVPARAGELRQNLLDLRTERGRGDRLRQEAQPRAIRGGSLQCRLQRGQKIAPGRDLAEVTHHLRAIRIVEAEHRCLHERIGRAEARGVIRIALDLRRASHVALDKHAIRVAADRHHGRKENRLAGDEPFRLANVRDNFLCRAVAGGQTAESHRRTHQLHEVAPVDATFDRQRSLWEFALDDLVKIVARQLVEAAPVFVADPLAEGRDCECAVFFAHGLEALSCWLLALSSRIRSMA